MKLLTLFLLFISSTTLVNAREMIFMKANHPLQDHEIHYILEEENCVITPSSPVLVRVFDKKTKETREAKVLEKVYFGIDHQELTKGLFSFYLNSLKDLRFDITLAKKGKKCIVSKVVQFESLNYEIDSFLIHYHYRLAFPTLNYIEFFNKTVSPLKPVLTIENYQARGYFPFYELKLGGAMFVHTNIRPNDKRAYHRQNPIYLPRPTFMVRYGPLFLNNDGLGSLLLPLEHFTLLAAFILEGEPYEAEGLRQRKQSIYFGPLIKSHFLEIHYYREVWDEHKGEVLKISLAPEFNFLSNYTFNPRIYYQLWDNRYVDYYFGVNKAEAAVAGHAYKGTQTENYGFEFRNTLKYKKFEYILSAGMKFYGSSVSNSPITVKNYEYQFLTGFLYNFF